MLDNSNFNDFYKNTILLLEYQGKILKSIQQMKEAPQLYSKILGKKLTKILDKIQNLWDTIEVLYLQDVNGDVINKYKFYDPQAIKNEFGILGTLDNFVQIYFPFPKSKKEFRLTAVNSISKLLEDIFDNFGVIVDLLDPFAKSLTSRFGSGFHGGSIPTDNFRSGSFIPYTKSYIKHNDDSMPQRYK
jgi:hypothetical protein